jgi:hypothetical protein
MLLFSPVPYAFLALFAPVALLVIIGFFGLIRLIIKENRKKDTENNENKTNNTD